MTITDYTENLEAHRLWRIRFDGCIQFAGDPPRGFSLDESMPADCSIQLSHSLDRGMKLQIRIYENTGLTRFADTAWDNQLRVALSSLSGSYKGEIVEPFEAPGARGTPILGHVSMEALLVMTATDTGKRFLYRICAVPFESGAHVLVVTFFAPEDQYSVVNPSVEAFLRSLYEPAE
ncbi:MAG TPA: hypothetical protein VJ960_03660 [Oceanipulchritudo sp.]|nr:hypothetical protein [Oceanipulchritudo sp.]